MDTGIMHPGAMGASLASHCATRTFWAGEGRSQVTRDRAREAGMTEVASVSELLHRCGVIVSVCPPDAALEQARLVAAGGFGGIYVDLNAVSPSTTRDIGGRFARFVDGCVIGPPVREPGTTRLYLAGAEAEEVAALWERGPLEVRIIDGPPGSASALKMCFATWTKGTAALLLAIRTLARSEAVEEALLEEWATSFPHLGGESELAASLNGPKAWRFTGEMAQIAATFSTHDLPGGFARAAAEVYRRMAPLKDSHEPSIDTVIDAIHSADPT